MTSPVFCLLVGGLWRAWTEVIAENFDLANVPKELYLFDDGGMAEWIADEVPAAKKRKAMSDVTSRFGNKLTSDFELKTMSKGFVPKSTEKSTIWAVRNFQSWCDWREKQVDPAEDRAP